MAGDHPPGGITSGEACPLCTLRSPRLNGAANHRAVGQRLILLRSPSGPRARRLAGDSRHPATVATAGAEEKSVTRPTACRICSKSPIYLCRMSTGARVRSRGNTCSSHLTGRFPRIWYATWSRRNYSTSRPMRRGSWCGARGWEGRSSTRFFHSQRLWHVPRFLATWIRSMT